MSEQHTPVPDDFPTWLAERGADAYALVRVGQPREPAGWRESQTPRAGVTGIARFGADLDRMTVQEVTQGRAETLRRWLQGDDGSGTLAIVTTESGRLAEHTPGDLAASLIRDPATDGARLTRQLADWLARRNAEAPQGLELGWIAAAAAWTCHMRALSSSPLPAVLALSMDGTGEQGDAVTELVTATSLRVADLLDRIGREYRPRAELVEDWHTLEPLAADVPELAATADHLLDQIALRDASAQQLRAVLEPDVADHLYDRSADGHVPNITSGALDEQRAAHLAQARETVRAYTAAAYAGRESQAQRIRDAFPAPARALTLTGPAAAWRQASATAQDALGDLAAQRAAAMAENGPDHVSDPELLHAQTAYLAARDGQLHLLHDALGRLAFPAEAPHAVPEELVPVVSAQTELRLIAAFGTLERAGQVLEGQISYQSRHPVPARRLDTSRPEADLLATARDALRNIGPAAAFTEEDVRIRVQEAMARSGAVAAPARAVLPAHDEAHRQARAADPSTPGFHR
ncbi:hypothetical protein OG458_42340 (plasmid) [Streptomyces sp. NBC_01281]|nr:hypothetical protein OG458_41465 [Streptomyces sp. NBC_01281]WSK66597.1 hypothetical protein OG458_42340 [Streptomyces sp. NBC_01281]